MMNRLKEVEKFEEPVKRDKKKNKMGQYLLSIVSGSFLSKEETLKLVPFVLFLFTTAILYIANGYYAEEKVRKISQITNELKELRSEYITSKSDLMFISKQSEVAKAVLEMGIKESVVPPKKILIRKVDSRVIKD